MKMYVLKQASISMLKMKNNIVFTKSATEAINLVASCFSEKYLNSGDEILLSYLEHHANIVPWQLAAKKKGFKILLSILIKKANLIMMI